MQRIGRLSTRLIGLAAISFALSACQTPDRPQARATPAPEPAQPTPGVVLNLYSGSQTGLVVGAGARGGNPGAELAGLVFEPNPGLPQTYIWAFTPGAAILDRDCHPLTITQAIGIAQAPVANAARFESGAAVRVQLWAKSAGTPSSCGALQPT